MNKKFFQFTPGFFLLAGILMLTGGTETLVFVLMAAGVHEYGHILMAGILGRKVESIRLTGLGAEMILSHGKLSYFHEIAIAVSGSAAGVLLAIVSARLGEIFESMYYLAGLSMTFSVFNMLPVTHLDGGRILYALTAAFFSPQIADVVCRIFSFVISSALIFVGGWVFIYTGGNITLLSTGIWLALRHASGKKPLKRKTGCYKIIN